jgi:sulfotransferase
VLCCVRNPAWILDSVERVLQGSPFEPNALFNFDVENNVYSRCEALTKHNGLVGAAYAALREAVYGPHAQRLALIRYESLVEHPLKTMNNIYDFLGEDRHAHDFEHVEPVPGVEEFDRRLGLPGLHEVLPKVTKLNYPSILPPDIFNRWVDADFWEKPMATMSAAQVRIISAPQAKP